MHRCFSWYPLEINNKGILNQGRHTACKHVREDRYMSHIIFIETASLPPPHSFPFWVKAGGGAQNQGVENNLNIIRCFNTNITRR